jgi:regulator of PEP synthase PpsR (kinase-PPPase family)
MNPEREKIKEKVLENNWRTQNVQERIIHTIEDAIQETAKRIFDSFDEHKIDTGQYFNNVLLVKFTFRLDDYEELKNSFTFKK